MPVSSTRTLSWIRPSTTSPADIDQHMAFLGELHGVAKQVGDDLPEATGVANDKGGQARVDTDDQLEILLGDACRHQRRHVLDGLGKAEGCGIERRAGRR